MPHPQLIGPHRDVAGSSVDQGIKAPIDVEISRGSICRRTDDAADTAAVGRADTSQVEQQPSGKASGKSRQHRVRCRGHLREQRQGVLGVLLDEVGECAFVDLADLRGDVVERRVLAKLFAWGGPLVLFGQRLLRIVALEGDGRSRVAP